MVRERYLDIVAAVDIEFSRNRRLHGEKIRCATGCTDCCHHPFHVTKIEAAHISEGVQRLDPRTREVLEARSREYLEAHQKLVADHGEPPPGTRLACPALDQGVCVIYEFRPLMCHKFGMPIYNPEKPGQIFACELNFKDGEEIDDSKLIQIQTGIHQSWKELQFDYYHDGGYRNQEALTVAHAILDDFSECTAAHQGADVRPIG